LTLESKLLPAAAFELPRTRSSREKARFRVEIGIAEVAEADAYQAELLLGTHLDPIAKRKGDLSKFLA
jgi:hypothetical protein